LLPYDTPHPLGTKFNMLGEKVVTALIIQSRVCWQDNDSHSSQKSLWDLKHALALGVECWKVI
jgi:hypothetical protein